MGKLKLSRGKIQVQDCHVKQAGEKNDLRTLLLTTGQLGVLRFIHF